MTAGPARAAGALSGTALVTVGAPRSTSANRLAAAVHGIGAPTVDEPLLDLGAQRSSFALDLRKALKKCAELLGRQLRIHGEEATGKTIAQSSAVRGIAQF